jgi:hypothetical protein
MPTVEPGVLADFQKRVDAYVAVHRKAEGSLPKLPDKATPEQITRHKDSLSQRIREARPKPVPGEVLTADMQGYIRRMLQAVFAGPEGAKLRASVMDENPTGLVVKVNDRYPPQIPLSSMPPMVLAALPKLAEELEYRFVGEALVIRDEHADLIVDYMPRALPR